MKGRIRCNADTVGSVSKISRGHSSEQERIRYARDTRIQHDKFLPDKRGRKGGIPPYHTRARVEIISK